LINLQPPSPQPRVVIVGTGPAGTSAALALLERGVRVHLLESGAAFASEAPQGSLLDLRFTSTQQWRWQLGPAAPSVGAGNVSPKLRVPAFRTLFDGYAQLNQIDAGAGFHLTGAIAGGGLSNAWGCGVASFDPDELGALADVAAEMRQSYRRVSQRVGLSGASDDALRDYFGLDQHSAPALPLDRLHTQLWERRTRLRAGLDLGRARLAVRAQASAGRQGCNQCGLCLWGCARGAMWSAAMDLAAICAHPLATVEFGAHVTKLEHTGDATLVHVQSAHGTRIIRAQKVLLAAGTIASTRLALAGMKLVNQPIRLQSNPMAAFLLFLPRQFGSTREAASGLAQLSFRLRLQPGAEPCFGNLFSTGAVPMHEFITRMPLSGRAALPLLRSLLPACIVGNVFFAGARSAHEISVNAAGRAQISSRQEPSMREGFQQAHAALSRQFRRLGAWLLPGSFVPGAPGADLHYASTLPIARHPSSRECSLAGQLQGLPGVYLLDGASLPRLPAKAHTLTIMANADRIARGLAVDN